MAEASDHILIETLGALGTITINRPAALNAVSHEMVSRMAAALSGFAVNDKIGAVLIQGAGGRAFCAGGDVRVFAPVPPGPALERLARTVFAAEYRLCHQINRFPKPVVALIDGIALGAGCGIAMNASHRVTTGRSVLAMPEVALGLFPDVGASWFFNRLPGEMGVYLGLTGQRLGAADAASLGMSTHHIDREAAPALIDALAAGRRADDALRHLAETPDASEMPARQARIDALFGGGTVTAIRAALAAAPEPWAADALARIDRASPTSLTVTLREIREGRGRSIEDCLRTEYRLAARITSAPDFREGVRAILVDKDNAPGWSPARLSQVESATIEGYFKPLAPAEPELDLS